MHARHPPDCPPSASYHSYGRSSGSTLTFIEATDPNLLLLNFFLTASRSPPSCFSTREICPPHQRFLFFRQNRSGTYALRPETSAPKSYIYTVKKKNRHNETQSAGTRTTGSQGGNVTGWNATRKSSQAGFGKMGQRLQTGEGEPVVQEERA